MVCSLCEGHGDALCGRCYEKIIAPYRKQIGARQYTMLKVDENRALELGHKPIVCPRCGYRGWSNDCGVRRI
jgi:hypothetical protein